MWLNKRIIGIRLKLSGRAQHVVPATEEGAVTKDSACPKTLLWNLPCLRPCIKNFLGQVLHGFVCLICFLGNIFDCFHTHGGISHILSKASPSALHIGLPLHASFWLIYWFFCAFNVFHRESKVLSKVCAANSIFVTHRPALTCHFLGPQGPQGISLFVCSSAKIAI